MEIKVNKQGEIELVVTLTQNDAAKVMSILFKQLAEEDTPIKAAPRKPREATSIASKLTRKRESLGVPLEYIAEELGVSVSCYRNYELGHRIPPAHRVAQIKKVFAEIKKSQERAVEKAQLSLADGGAWPAFGKPNIKLA